MGFAIVYPHLTSFIYSSIPGKPQLVILVFSTVHSTCTNTYLLLNQNYVSDVLQLFEAICLP